MLVDGSCAKIKHKRLYLITFFKENIILTSLLTVMGQGIFFARGTYSCNFYMSNFLGIKLTRHNIRYFSDIMPLQDIIHKVFSILLFSKAPFSNWYARLVS